MRFGSGIPSPSSRCRSLCERTDNEPSTSRQNLRLPAEIPPWIGASTRQLRNCRRAGDDCVPLVRSEAYRAQRASTCLISSGHSQVSARPRHRLLLPLWFGAGGVRALHSALAAPHRSTRSRRRSRTRSVGWQCCSAACGPTCVTRTISPYRGSPVKLASRNASTEPLPLEPGSPSWVAAPASLAERERTRGLILEGLMTSHRRAPVGTMPPQRNTRSDGKIRRDPGAGARTHRSSRSW